jgi:hypothetical protein
VINAIKFSIEEIEASDQYFDHTGALLPLFRLVGVPCIAALWRVKSLPRHRGDRPKLNELWPYLGLIYADRYGPLARFWSTPTDRRRHSAPSNAK